MPQVSFITPLDQPSGSKRLLDILRTGLKDPRFTQLRIVTAYAKSGPLLRLKSDIESWIAAGNSLCAIVGIDQQGTSKEALTIAADLCKALYITRENGITFHPKIYLFDGPKYAKVIIGSNNLTVGGTETNFESSIILDLVLPEDDSIYNDLETMWGSLLPHSCVATKPFEQKLLDELIANGAILSELDKQARAKLTGNYPTAPRTGLVCKPASPLPASIMKRKTLTPKTQATGIMGQLQYPQQVVAGLIIQIKPHHNGEIFLSKIAVLQNQSFFGWPFKGSTTPKKAGNPAYPQRTPDPVVNINVYGPATTPTLTLNSYKLNTVYYSAKEEIRITASPLISQVPDYSIMVMMPGNSAGIDYEICIYRPDNPQYTSWLSACNQSMPSGGKKPRKFGWF
ncbi:phospholipase D family protein [Dickeya zeae]|uniref:phospholipase D family protein n=1 Tax=Dickeya zeae TaxID=204042 RepID=UPI0003177781|nr:phospholipase D family protein [Dickeya zeae]AJC64954.1 NgoFVII restriction endonuclease domain protein [Dickeya zeae EC1]